MDHQYDQKNDSEYSKSSTNSNSEPSALAQLQPPPFQLMAKPSSEPESEESTTEEKTTQLKTANGEAPSPPHEDNSKPNNTGLFS